MKKIALVTGAAGGIGQAIVCRLAEEGMKVYANARSEEKLKKQYLCHRIPGGNLDML